MGSYATYGSTGATAVVINKGAPEPPTGDVSATVPDPTGVIDPALAREIGQPFVDVINGHIFIGGISALDVGSIMVLILTALGALMKLYYDYTDWRERRLARLVEEDIENEAESPPS